MGGTCSKALLFGDPSNKKKYNGIEHTNEFDINQYDAFYRRYDSQIGRFLQIDPKIESAESWAPFSAMIDNPISHADPLGDSTIKPQQFSFNPFSPIIYQGYANVKAENVRNEYNNKATQLNPNDKKSRLELKEKARSNTPEPFKSVIEKGRPIGQEQAKINDPNFKGNANKTNLEVNETIKTTGALGKAFIIAGAIQSTITIVNSDSPAKETITEGAGWAAAMYGGSTFASAAAPFGPYVSMAAGGVGSVIGFCFGKKIADLIITQLSNPTTEDPNILAMMGK